MRRILKAMRRVLAVVVALTLASASALACAAMAGQDRTGHSCCQTKPQPRAKCCAVTPAPEPQPATGAAKPAPAELISALHGVVEASPLIGSGRVPPAHAFPQALYLSYRSLRL
jgi:hypothetical protein